MYILSNPTKDGKELEPILSIEEIQYLAMKIVPISHSLSVTNSLIPMIRSFLLTATLTPIRDCKDF